MTDLVVRNTTPGSAPVAPITGVGGQLPEVLQLCNAIAAAGELIPQAYRGKPGAVLLAKMWADKHDIDVFTAIQQIFPIDGKPYVSAEMRVALATKAGFDLRVTESTGEVCTIEVWFSDQQRKRGAVTVRFDDSPRKLETGSGKPTPWKLHPDDMLFAEACRKADRRFVKTAAAMLDSAQDYTTTDAEDVLDTLAAPGEPEEPPAGPEAADTAPNAGSSTPAESGPVGDAARGPSEDELRALAKAKKQRLADVLRYAGEATVQDIVTNGKAGDVKRWIEANE